MNDEILTSQPPVDPRGRAAPSELSAQGVAAREKFDLHGGREPTVLPSAPLPWGYGLDRVTLLVRSPDSLYLYWEITDAGIESARARLGPAGAHGWFNLRMYDTTGRDFDGTNANHYVDLTVDRGQREHYVAVNRPGSSMHVEIGIKTHEGFFQPIARSGRGDFPRKSPSPNTSLEWMTVTDGNDHPVAQPYFSRYQGPEPIPYEPSGPPSQPPPSQDASAHAMAAGAEREVHVSHASHREREVSWSVSRSFTSEWVTLSPHDLGQVVELAAFFRTWQTQWRTDLRFLRWLGQWPGGPLPRTAEMLTWHAGPFHVDAGDLERVEIHEQGVPMLLPGPWGDVQVAGPWRVTIRERSAAPVRRVLATWTMHVVRRAPVVAERWLTSIERTRFDEHAFEEASVGASESFVRQLGGASEAYRLGASERLWMGASEWAMFGASETLAMGGSEMALLGIGASALLLGGASEWRAAGASEWRAAGASERLLLGGSEAHMMALGGSESALHVLAGSASGLHGASGSAWLTLGGSEGTLVGASDLTSGGRSGG